MAARRPRFGEHTGLQISYTPVEAHVGGQLLERRAGIRKVGIAAAGSLKVAGVAFHDVKATQETPDAVIVNEAHGQTVWRGVVIDVTYAAAAVAGDKLIAAANGQVTPAGANPDSRSVIGECFEDTSLGAVGPAVIY